MFTFITRVLAMSGLILLIDLPALASPIGYQDSFMMMGDFNQNWREAGFNYAPTQRDAFGFSHIEMRSMDNQYKRTLDEVNYTRLLSRWNLPDAQSNLWLFMGLGSLSGQNHSGASQNNFNKLMLSPGVQFDYETTRIYFAATHRLYRASNINQDVTSVRSGFSFYETEYDQTQPWFIVEARYMHNLSDKVEITPMLRLINKNIFIEGGINNDAQPRLNVMYTF